MRTGARLILLAGACTIASCGGGSGSTTSTTVVSVKDAVRQQLDTIVTSYLQNIATQMPSVTSKVGLPDITTCVKERVNQVITSAEQQPGQPDPQFASTLMGQAQSSIYGFIGQCAKLVG